MSRILVSAVAVIISGVVAAPAAVAGHGCVVDLYGRIQCAAHGSRPGDTRVTPPASGGGSVNAAPASTVPPRRYLQTRFDPVAGNCWVWSRTPPGLDAWDNANDAAIINTRSRLPACPRNAARPATRVDVPGTAWSIFRQFQLELPVLRLEPPDHGITGLPTYASTQQPAPLTHTERLPNGRNLEVRAEIVGVEVSWGDGAVTAHDLGSLRPYPAGTATHTYATRTCPASYRVEHPTGGNCHPTLEAYPVVVTHRWQGRYRYDAGWVDLGVIERTTTTAYDVDEVVGVLQP